MMVCRRGIVAQVGSPPALKFIRVARDNILAHSAGFSRNHDQEKAQNRLK